MATTIVTLPNVQLSLDDLIQAMRQLAPEARTQVAKALIQDDLDRRLLSLMQRLAEKEPPADITQTDIDAEVRSVRTRHQ
jgi:hypothetical protein